MFGSKATFPFAKLCVCVLPFFGRQMQSGAAGPVFDSTPWVWCTDGELWTASFGEVSSVNMASNIALFAIIRRMIFYSVFMSMCKIPFLKSRNGQICSYLHMCIHVHTDCIFIIINVHLQIKNCFISKLSFTQIKYQLSCLCICVWKWINIWKWAQRPFFGSTVAGTSARIKLGDLLMGIARKPLFIIDIMDTKCLSYNS